MAGSYPDEWPILAERIKDAAGWKCDRCGHRHETPGSPQDCTTDCKLHYHPEAREFPGMSRRRQRVLTVHHLDELKFNLAWWNLAALCQVCHLVIQGRSRGNVTFWYASKHRMSLEPWMEPYAYGLALYLASASKREQTAGLYWAGHPGDCERIVKRRLKEWHEDVAVTRKAKQLATGAGQKLISIHPARPFSPRGMSI